MDFLLPKGETPTDPSGAWEAVRQQAKIFYEYLNNLTERFREYLRRDDIDNHVDNYVIDETRNYTPRYTVQGFYCASQMTNDVQRKAFPHIYKFGEYAFISYMAGEAHSINALKPFKLRYSRSRDLWRTSEEIEPKVINDGGIMRAIDPLTDGFFVHQPIMTETSDGRIWLYIPTLQLTTNPPTLSNQWDVYKTFLSYSSDLGTTWSELTELNAAFFPSSAKPIIIGDEIWFPAYNGTGASDYDCYILKYNYVTDTVGTPQQMNGDWTGLEVAEPAILEYVTGRYMAVARVTYNNNFPGAETANRGVVIAYSTDGIDWSDYEFLNWGNQFPNQPKLFMYKGYVYFLNFNVMYHGKPSADLLEIEWIIKNPNADWRLQHGFIMMTFEASLGGALYRGDPRTATLGNQVSITRVSGADFVVWDEDKEILLTTIGYHNDASGVYLAEPWVGIIKRNSVKADFSLTERLIYSTEISGSLPWITIHNSYALFGNEIKVQWADRANDNISLTAEILSDAKVKFTAGQVMSNAKIVYEIFKS